MAGWRVRMDRFRLPRRAYALWLAIGQFSIRHRRYVRLSQRQFSLLQSLVGKRPGAASVSALELAATKRGNDRRVGTLQSRRSGVIPKRQESGEQEGRAAYASGMEGEV